MRPLWVFRTLFAAWPVLAQQVCPPTPIYSPCEIVFELNDQEASAHPNPYLSVDLKAELRSPKKRTILTTAFWDGGRKMVIRLAPHDPGAWDFRITSNLARFDGKLGHVEARPSADAGFLLPANVHHWMTSEDRKPHLWMGDTFLGFARAPQEVFDRWVSRRAQQKFNHVRGAVLGAEGEQGQAFPQADRPEPAFFQQLDRRIQALNANGMFADLVLAANPGQLLERFPSWQQRERFIRYMTSRYAAYHITWQIFGEFESHPDARALLRELGGWIQKMDPYQHPRSTGTQATSGPALPDGWMQFVVHHSPDDTLGAVEHQLFPVPFVNTGFAVEAAVSAEAFRKRLWNASMNGQYPVGALDEKNPDSSGAKAMAVWRDFFARTRYWELEPYFDLDGGRALALPGVEYVVYLEKAGPVEMLVEKHSYDVFWLNPATGELHKEKKEFKGERFTGSPPAASGDWVLHVSREGRKESMLRSYKFESRPNLMQEIEQNPQKAPFEIIEPAADRLERDRPPKFEARLKRETRGTRHMHYLWTAEAPAEGRGYRVLATGAAGVLHFPAHLAKVFPAVLNLRLYALNAMGKVYAVDKVYRLQ